MTGSLLFATVDPRGIAGFRIWLALVCLSDTVRRAAHFELYAQGGIMPATPGGQPLPTFLDGIGDAPLTLFFVGLVFVQLAMLVGAGSRVAAVLNAIGVIALNDRAALLETGGDGVLAGTVLWACLLPLGERFSFDARWRDRPPRSAIVSPVFFGMLAHWALAYVINAVLKHGDAWLQGEALLIALRGPRVTTPFGAWMATEGPRWFLSLATWSTLLIEGAIPLLLFSPWKRHITRTLACVLIAGLHAGIASMMNVGVFSYVMTSVIPLFLPREVWDRIEGRLLGAAPARWDPSPSLARRAQTAAEAGLVVFILGVFGVQVGHQCFDEAHRLDRPEWFEEPFERASVYKSWGVFAPTPPGEGMYFVVDAVTRSGRHVDPLRALYAGDDRVHFQMPAYVGMSHLYYAYTDRIGIATGELPIDGLDRMIMAYGDEADPIVSYDVWRLTASSGTRWRRDPDAHPPGGVDFAFPDEIDLGARVVGSEGVLHADRMSDGHFAIQGTEWRRPLASPMASRCAFATFELPRPAIAGGVWLQGDANDRFRILAERDGDWVPVGTVQARQGHGQQGRHASLRMGFPARRFRVVPQGGDSLYSVAEVRFLGRQLTAAEQRAAYDAAAGEPVAGAAPTRPAAAVVLSRPPANADCFARSAWAAFHPRRGRINATPAPPLPRSRPRPRPRPRRRPRASALGRPARSPAPPPSQPPSR